MWVILTALWLICPHGPVTGLPLGQPQAAGAETPRFLYGSHSSFPLPTTSQHLTDSVPWGGTATLQGWEPQVRAHVQQAR